MMLEKGTVVRGSWSATEYRVEHSGRGVGGVWLNCRAVDNPRQTGTFNYLGERVGNEIEVTQPGRGGDRLIVLREPKVRLPVGQLELGL